MWSSCLLPHAYLLDIDCALRFLLPKDEEQFLAFNDHMMNLTIKAPSMASSLEVPMSALSPFQLFLGRLAGMKLDNPIFVTRHLLGLDWTCLGRGDK
jgi:hypothetical protein